MSRSRGTSRIKPSCWMGKLLIGSFWILLALVPRAFSNRNDLAHRLYVTGHSMGGAGALLAATSHRALDKHGYWTVSTLYWSLLCEIAWIIAIVPVVIPAWTWTWMPYSALLSTSQFDSGRSWYFVKHCKIKASILLKPLVWNAVKMVIMIAWSSMLLRDITLRSLRLCCCGSCRCIWGTTSQLCARHQRSTVQHC